MKGRLFVLRVNGAGAAPPAAPLPPEPPINLVAPVIAGTPQAGESVMASGGTWAGSPIPVLTYQWRRAGAPIPGATSMVYTLQPQDAGLQVWCEVTGTNPSGVATVTTAAVLVGGAPVANVAPSNVVLPSISGAATVGSVLTVSPGSWLGVPTPAFAFQWLRSGTPIPGATGTVYTTQPGDASADVACRVVATNVAGSAIAVSNAITVVAPSAGVLAWLLSAWAPGAWRAGSWGGAPVGALARAWLEGAWAPGTWRSGAWGGAPAQGVIARAWLQGAWAPGAWGSAAWGGGQGGGQPPGALARAWLQNAWTAGAWGAGAWRNG